MAYTKRPDAELLEAALIGYQHQYTILGERMAEITRELGGKPGRPDADAGGDKPKRTMSASARRRIGAAQRKRWAAVKGTTGTPAKRAKRHMSAEGREAIAEATRKRWEAYRAAKAK